jgi:hypothetical protein
MLVGLAVIVTVGAGGLTVTVTESLSDPPLLVQVRVKVVVALRLPVDTLVPDVEEEPFQVALVGLEV